MNREVSKSVISESSLNFQIAVGIISFFFFFQSALSDCAGPNLMIIPLIDLFSFKNFTSK